MRKIYYESITSIENEELFETLLNRVHKSRRKKVLSCKQPKDRLRSLLAGLLLRQMLEEEGLDYEKLEFAVLEGGKPYLVSHPQLQFNVSHAGDYVICAISDVPIGADIEYIGKSVFQKERHLDTLAKRCLSPMEWEIFSQSRAKASTFLEYWTKKEAYSKCIGKGLRINFAEIDTETHKKEFCSMWINHEYCISIYEEKTSDYNFTNIDSGMEIIRCNLVKNR